MHIAFEGPKRTLVHFDNIYILNVFKEKMCCIFL